MTEKYHKLKLKEQLDSEIKMVAELMKTPENDTVTDSIGNRYRQEIGLDGAIHLILIESYNGELYE